MRVQTATVETILGRGVFKAPFLADGCEVLHAIDSRGNCLRQVKLLNGASEARVVAFLEQLLDERDPIPKLELVKVDPPRVRIDPCQVVDALTWSRMQRSPKLKRQVMEYVDYLESRRQGA